MINVPPIKTPEDIALMAEGGRRLARVMQALKTAVKPGVSTAALNALAEKLILQAGAELAFKGYENFPAAICTSINDEVVHCVPHEERVLRAGDVVGIDIGLKYQGFYLDMAETIGVGDVSFEARRLMDVTKKALRLALKKVRPGATTGDIGNTIQRFVESQGFDVVRDFVGHGIGRELHEEPALPNFGKRHGGAALKPGMVIAIEPMVVVGDSRVKKLPDGHGVATADGSLAAHFEATLAVTERGHEVLTVI